METVLLTEERRQFLRSAYMADVAAQIQGQWLHLFVYDLSMDGCMLQTADTDVFEGQTIVLQFDDHCTTVGIVLWKKNITAGMHSPSFDGHHLSGEQEMTIYNTHVAADRYLFS